MTENTIRQLADKLLNAADWAKEYADQMQEALLYADDATNEAIPIKVHNAIIALVEAAENAEIEARTWSNAVGDPDDDDDDDDDEPEPEDEDEDEERAA